MRCVFRIRRHGLFDIQVMAGEDVQIGFQRLGRMRLTAQGQAQCGHLWSQGTQAVAEDHPATGAARRALTTGDKGRVTARHARVAQPGDRMAHAARRS